MGPFAARALLFGGTEKGRVQADRLHAALCGTPRRPGWLQQEGTGRSGAGGDACVIRLRMSSVMAS